MAKEQYVSGFVQTSGQTIGASSHKVENLESNAVISAAKITDPEIRLDFGSGAYQKTIQITGENIRINYVKTGAVSRYKYVGDLAEPTNVVLNGNAGETCIIRGRVTSAVLGSIALRELDVTKATALTMLSFGGNEITSINVTNCKQLKELNCYYNCLTSLDVSMCTQLVKLECYENQITSLDLTKCTQLTSLNCYDNQLTSLDVSRCKELTYIDAGDTPMYEDEDALLAFFNSLPIVSGENAGQLYEYYNETDEMRSIAEAKNWELGEF